MQTTNFLASSLLLLVTALPAEDLGGGKPASHGRVPRCVLTHWVPGQPSEVRFVDLPASAPLLAMIVSPSRGLYPLPFGDLIADPAAAGAISLAVPATLPLTIPAQLANATLYLQGFVLEGTGGVLTDATKVDLYNPVVIVGNQRQSANSLSLIDLPTRTVKQTITDSENGSIAFSKDRRYAYVCEPGLQRNRVAVYDFSTTPVTTRTPIPVSGGIRYQPTVSPDGKRMYVPIHTGVSVIDIDAQSTTFHSELLTIPTPIIGASGSILEGPFDLAITPDGKKLLVCYGERIANWQTTPGTLGVIDLTSPSYPHTAIGITNSGALTLLGTPLLSRERVEVSPDGRYAYTAEFAFTPSPYTQGYPNGGTINIVDLVLGVEVAVIPFGGYGVHEFVIDRCGRNLWIAANDLNRLGQVTRIDVDRRSATKHTILKTIQVDPVSYPAGGAFGIGSTPDGATVCVSLCEDGSHATPVLITIDALTNTIFGAPIAVQSLPATVGIPQR